MELKKYFIKNKARESIEAEEIFLDAEAIRSLEEKGKLEYPIKRGNFIFLYILIIVCLLGLLGRAGYLQIVKGEYYLDLAQGNKLRIYPTAAPRGIIYDRFGQPLVYNIPSFDLVVNLSDFLDNSIEVQETILEEVSAILEQGINDHEKDSSLQDELRQKIGEAQGQMSRLFLIKGIDRSIALILKSLVNDWPGLRMEENTQRQYLLGSYFAHILGYTGQVSLLDLKSYPDYLLNDQIGKNGLECEYESLLRGEPGHEQIEVDSLGKTQNLLASKSAQPGQSLLLHVDRELQKKLYQALSKMLSSLKGSKRRAAAIAINPNNGGVLALVSLPSFDNNLFAQGISQTDLESLDDDPSQPFLNRVMAGQYPPGSTIKPLMAAAALQEEVVKSSQRINCQGNISIANKYNPQIIYHFSDWKVHGLTDIIKAIAESCNIYFYTIGGGYGQIDGLGIDRIKKYLQYFGLGQTSQIDLPYEETGLIPDREWKKEKKLNEEWYLGDTYHLAIGQGDILITPLQMTLAIASIANNGILYQPQLVDKIIDSNIVHSQSFEIIQDKNIIKDILAKVIREEFIDPANLETVRQGMRQAVLSGSAIALSRLPVKVAGKTGTAQFGTEDQTHAWFVGFAPYNEPQIVLTILVEGGGEGHKAAVPVAKEVLEWYFGHN